MSEDILRNHRLRYKILIPKPVKRREKMEHQEAFDSLSKMVECDQDAWFYNNNKIRCVTDWGAYSVRDDKNSTIIEVSRDMMADNKEFSAGLLVRAALRAFEDNTSFPPKKMRVFFGEGSRMRRIDDLIAVCVDAQHCGKREIITEYALPLHYLKKNHIVKESEIAINNLEFRAVRAIDGKRGNKDTSILIVAEKIWGSDVGVTDAFLLGETDKNHRVETYRKQNFNHDYGARHSEPNPRSGGAQSP